MYFIVHKIFSCFFKCKKKIAYFLNYEYSLLARFLLGRERQASTKQVAKPRNQQSYEAKACTKSIEF